MGALASKAALKWLFGLIAFALLFALGFVGVRAYLASGGYEFRAQSIEGEKRLSDFKGQYVLVYFGYTSCPDICPLGLSEIGSALEGLDTQKVQLLFITLDPARDDVASVDKYVKHFYPHSYGLRLEEPALRELAARYGVKYEKIALKDSALGYAVAHSSAVFVFDERGEMVGKVSNVTKEEILAALMGNSAFAPFSRFCEAKRAHLPPQVTPSSALTKSQNEVSLEKSSQNPRIAGDLESSPKDSKNISESPRSESHTISESTVSVSYSTLESAPSVIASVAKQSIKQDSESVDCHAGKPARNDRKTESVLHASLESKTNSETPSGGVYLHRDKNKNARSANLKGVVGERGLSRGEGATSQFKPLPLNKKEKEILKNNRILEVKAGVSEKLDLESKNLESATDSEFTPPVIASVAKQSIKQVSEIVDCHAGKPARNDDRLDSQSIDCHEATASRNDTGRDSKSGDSNAGLARNDKASQSPETKPTDSEPPHITQRANTPLLLIFTSAHCRSCEQLAATISSSPKLKSALNTGIDTYTIDERTPLLSLTLASQGTQTQSARELARRLQVRGTPTLIFISPQGKRLLSYPGAMSESKLLASLELIKSRPNLSEQDFVREILSYE